MFHVERHKITTHTVSRETFETVDQLISNNEKKLTEYLEQLLWWNKRVNLVSRDVSRETVWEHIRHSLLISQINVFNSSEIIVDAGTGGGLPGIPLAITHPNKHFILNDLVTKKCLAIKQIAQKLNLKNLAIVDGSIENLSQDSPFLLISKHAFKINELFKMAATLPWDNAIFYKGIDFKGELSGIEVPLKVDVYKLSEESKFYEGKSLIVVNR
jgi:16S rRNA (guanine527-N7)-methyltransferase